MSESELIWVYVIERLTNTQNTKPETVFMAGLLGGRGGGSSLNHLQSATKLGDKSTERKELKACRQQLNTAVSRKDRTKPQAALHFARYSS